MIRDIRKIKKRVHKLNVRYKAKILALEKENKEIKKRLDEIERDVAKRLDKIERDVAYCQKYDSYYDE